MPDRFDFAQLPASSLRLSRRALLRRSLVLGTGAVVGAGLLGGCWPFADDDGDGDDNDDDPTPTPNQEPTAEPTPDETPTPEPTPTPDPTPTPIPVPDEPQEGGTLVVALPADPFSLHPNADSSVTNWVVISQLHNALMMVDHNFEVQHDLAESVEIAEDGSEYAFSVRQGVLFHNGDEMTIDDVVYTHEWMQEPENGAGRSFYYERVESIEAEDNTIRFLMGAADATFLRRAATTYIVNAAYHEDAGPEGHSLEPIGTGPFRLVDWNRDQSLTLERFDDYFDSPPHLDGLEFVVVPDAADRTAGVQSGDLDAVFDLEPGDSLDLADTDEVTTVQVDELDCLHIALNNEAPQFSDSRVRLAMLYAIERPPIIESAYQGAATPATSYLSPALEEWHEAMIEGDGHLPDRAVELLEEAGWTEGDDGIRELDGERLSFTCAAPDGGDSRFQAAEMVSEMLAEVGIEMQVEEADLTEVLNEMREGEREAAIFNWIYGGWLGEPDGRTSLQTGAFNNFSQFSNIQVDNLLVQGVGELDAEARQSLYVTIQERVAELVPFVFIAFPHSHYHFSQRVQGVPESALWGNRLFQSLRDFWIFERDES